MNTPAFFGMLPPVDGLVCLDLGCGEGHNTRLLAGKGARVAGLDLVASFIIAAAGQDRTGICYLIGDGAVLPFRASVFDAVTAFMSLMDVAEPERTLGEVARVLRPGGFVQFSVVHPLLTAPGGRWLRDEAGARQARVVGDYFHEGPVTETWTFSGAPAELRGRYQPFTITYAYRTVAGWLSAVLGAGLVIEAVAEPRADEEAAPPTSRRLRPGSPLTSSSCGPGSRSIRRPAAARQGSRPGGLTRRRERGLAAFRRPARSSYRCRKR